MSFEQRSWHRLVLSAFCRMFAWCHDTQPNDTKHNGTQINENNQPNNTKHNDTQHIDTKYNGT
jgi:hypothetical protein